MWPFVADAESQRNITETPAQIGGTPDPWTAPPSSPEQKPPPRTLKNCRSHLKIHSDCSNQRWTLCFSLFLQQRAVCFQVFRANSSDTVAEVVPYVSRRLLIIKATIPEIVDCFLYNVASRIYCYYKLCIYSAWALSFCYQETGICGHSDRENDPVRPSWHHLSGSLTLRFKFFVLL